MPYTAKPLLLANTLRSKRDLQFQMYYVENITKAFKFVGLQTVLLSRCWTMNESNIKPQLSQVKLGVFCYIMTLQNTVDFLRMTLYKHLKL
jgi:hypothetical protein